MLAPHLTRRSLVLYAAVVVVPALLLVVALVEFQRASERLAVERTDRTAALMHEYVTKQFETHDLILDRVSDRIDGLSDEEIAVPAIHALLATLAGQFEQVVSIWITDRDGRVIAGSHAFSPGSTLTRHAFWRALRDGHTGMIIGDPFVGVATGAASIALARRRPSVDGVFLGTMHVALSPDYVAGVFASLAPVERHDAVLAVHGLPEQEELLRAHRELSFVHWPITGGAALRSKPKTLSSSSR